MSVTTTTNYTISVTVNPAIVSVNLSNASLSAGPANAGDVIGAVSVTTNPAGTPFAGPVVLSGTDAAKFALTNGGMLPCNLVVGAANIPAGFYAISLSGTE